MDLHQQLRIELGSVSYSSGGSEKYDPNKRRASNHRSILILVLHLSFRCRILDCGTKSILYKSSSKHSGKEDL